MIQFQSITALPVGGSLLVDAPAGFAVEAGLCFAGRTRAGKVTLIPRKEEAIP